MARPQKTGAPNIIGAAVLQFEWIVFGFTAESFWTARRRLIAALEGLSEVQTLTDPIESQ